MGVSLKRIVSTLAHPWDRTDTAGSGMAAVSVSDIVAMTTGSCDHSARNV